MKTTLNPWRGFLLASCAWHALAVSALAVPVDMTGFSAGGREGIGVTRSGDEILIAWPIGECRRARMVLDLSSNESLIKQLSVDPSGAAFLGLQPVWFVTVGSRVNPPGKPPGSEFNVFFDAPAKRPHQAHASRLTIQSAKVTGDSDRATVAVGRLSAGPFSGELRLTAYAGSPLVHAEAALSTQQDMTAFIYDAGWVASSPGWSQAAWRDTEGAVHDEPIAPDAPDRSLAVRHRAVAVGNAENSLAAAAFPPPHQFFYPRDRTDNQQTAWIGKRHRGLEARSGFGVRQTETGGGSFVPWFNAPPGTEQRMGMFLLVHPGDARGAIDEALKLTRGDRFADVPGHVTFASHWHMATAVAAMAEQAAGKGRTTPDFVKMFKDMNVRVVHLAEFHGDGHPQDPGPLRLPELQAMFDECRRLSDADLLFMPGEEANVHLGVRKPGQHPGHWLYLFPRPVAWTMVRAPNQPFVEPSAQFGKLYHVGDAVDMARLIEEEHGLAWTAHPRIKASSWAPDAYRDAPYYRSDSWLGGAWKAMPADLSEPRLGRRVLDLLDDMANWGGDNKYVLGEVDVFKLDHAHELFGHMNINYLRLDKAPRYADDWSPILDALRGGKFFVTTGEVLLTGFTVGGVESGGRARLGEDGKAEIKLELEWTFPMAFAEVISGDGQKVYRERVALTKTHGFGKQAITLQLDLKGRKWARVEAWDVAANGAFSQPVWLQAGP